MFIVALLSQLFAYSVWSWLTFLAITAASAFAMKWPGVLIAQVIIAGMIATLDVRWVQAEMAKPGWTGQPDQDFMFMLGMLFRIVLVNAALLPVAAIAMRMARAPGGVGVNSTGGRDA